MGGVKRKNNDLKDNVSKIKKEALEHEEIVALKNLMHSENSVLFELKMNELISSVKITTINDELEKFLSDIEQTIRSITPRTINNIGESGKFEDVFIPFKLDKNVTLNFNPPTSVSIVGSFRNRTAIRPVVNIDMCVEIPSTSITALDSSNFMYFSKRALYLAFLTVSLIKSDFVEKAEFAFHMNNKFRPILLLTSKAPILRRIKVLVHVVPKTGVFSLGIFHPNRSNIKSRKIVHKESPFYNFSCLVDICMTNHNAIISESLTGNLGDVLILVKVWAKQRGLDCLFSGFVLSMLFVYLVRNNTITESMTVMQILRNFFLFLDQTDISIEPISLCVGENNRKMDQNSRLPSLDDFSRQSPLVFVDSTGFVNILSHVQLSHYKMLRHEAGLSLKILSELYENSFELLFITPIAFYEKFDLQFKISNSFSRSLITKFNLESKYEDTGNSVHHTLIPHLESIFIKSLTDRVTHIFCLLTPCHQWPVESPVPKNAYTSGVRVGLLLDGNHCYKTVDRLESKDPGLVASFREFWGEQCTLRRFPDGIVCESVLWPAKTFSAKRGIIKNILKYILNLHCGGDGKCVSVFELAEKQLISRKLNKKREFCVSEDETHVEMNQLYTEFCKIIQSLTSLSLNVDIIQSLSPILRFAETFPNKYTVEKTRVKVRKGHCIPYQGSSLLPPFIQPVQVLSVMESSNKWPADFQAVRRLKALFYIKMAQELKSTYSIQAVGYADRLDVIYKSVPWRLEITFPNETNAVQFVSKEKLEEHRYNYSILPQLNLFLINAQHTNTRAYCCGVRIIKRWLASHLLLSLHIPEIVVEIIASYVCTQSLPFTTPMSPRAVFVRFVRLMSEFDWKSKPLICDPHSVLSCEDREEVLREFENNRSRLPSLFVVTPVDKFSFCTRDSPSSMILRRIAQLSKRTLSMISADMANISLEANFGQFNILILLKKKILSFLYGRCGSSSEEDQKPRGLPHVPVLDYNPVNSFVYSLAKRFSQQALFFYDVYGGNTVGVLLKPSFTANIPFSIEDVKYRRPAIGDDGISVELCPDLTSFVEDIKIIGGNLIDDLIVK